MSVRIRAALPVDAPVIHRFIRELAAYERAPDAVEATVESLREQMELDRPPFECLIGEWQGEPAGFALYFHNYSTWKGRRGLYLEDLYVSPAFRRQGIGRALFLRLAAIAVERGCPRLEWAVLHWNKPAIEFYEDLGAACLTEWVIMRLQSPALEELGRSEPPAAG